MNKKNRRSENKGRLSPKLKKTRNKRVCPGRRTCPVKEQNPEQLNFSGVSDFEESGRVQEQYRENEILSGEFRWMSRAYKTEPAMERIKPNQLCGRLVH